MFEDFLLTFNVQFLKLFQYFFLLLRKFWTIWSELWFAKLNSRMFKLIGVNVTLAIVTPKWSIRKTQSNRMFSFWVMLDHVTFYISGTSKSLAFQTNPVLLSVLAFMTLKFRKMFAIFVKKELNQIFDLLVFDMWTVKFWWDSKSSLILCDFESHCCLDI